ncbi:WD40-repeat-containing domain protein [Lipomyces japonicus]|uniref:WD40-repeat-containing domain protein n=1 Tax=Lipomyces japonicus TaxID=56871 RepID=UPI0034CD3200
MSPASVSVPVYSVDPTFHDAIDLLKSRRSQKESFWVAGSNRDVSRHGLVDVYRSGNDVNLRGQDGFEIASIDSSIFLNGFRIRNSHVSSNWAVIKAPQVSINTGTPIEAFDISPQGSLYVVGNSSGQISVHSVSGGALSRALEGHLTYVSAVKFFSSGQVILSAGGDMQIKLWSVIDGSNPRTFTGHVRPITSLALIGKGRNFLSSSLDGTIKLWECGSGELLRSIAHPNSESLKLEATAVAVGSRVDGIKHDAGELEFEVEDKLAVAGYSNGDLLVFNLAGDPHPVVISGSDVAVNSLEVIDGKIYAAKGKTVDVYDLKSLNVVIKSLYFSSIVTDITAKDDVVAFATEVGTPVIINGENPPMYGTGFGVLPVIGAKIGQDHSVYFAGDDHIKIFRNIY